VTDVDRLFSVPLEDFVAERKQVAKELRAAGEREAAAEVAKLPKPTPPAWALNHLAREDPKAVGEWLDAAEELRAVSASPGAGLREAMAAHREATRTLLGVVRDRAQPGGKPLSEPMLERVRELLQAATVDADVADSLRAGRIVESGEPVALPGLDGADVGDAPASKPAGKGGKGAASTRTSSRAAERRAAKEREAERKAKERDERVAELERRIAAAEEEVARLRADADERDAAAAAAEERLDDARRTLHRTESEASAASDAAEDARAAVATAERELRQLARQLRSASS
jgi:hypothetical protein